MVKGKKYELSIEEIEDTYGTRVNAVIPLDEVVPMSNSERIPAYIYGKHSDFVDGVSRLASLYAGQPVSPSQRKVSILAKILAIFGLGRPGRKNYNSI
ncbi:MAG: hypothetical protein QXN59_02280, partial [Candidatus Micrarchaeaceae archaeon]